MKRNRSSAATSVLVMAAVIMTLPARAKEAPIQCANLIYGGTHTSRCFSDEFLTAVQRKTAIGTARRFRSVKLAAEELFKYPFVVMTGEADFHFTARERENLERYLQNGGFLLASAGCSSEKWDRSFRREIKSIFGKTPLKAIPMDHAIFRSVETITKLELHHPAEPAKLYGLEIKGKIVCVYSSHGLNDSEHAEGCCCCGGNEIENALDVNVNVLVYALLH